MLISKGTLKQDELMGQVAVVTGAGGGIGYEAVRALVWLGCRVIIAEIDRDRGKAAADRIIQEFNRDSTTFIHSDVGDEGSVERLAREAFKEFGKVDIVINNATLAPLGAVSDVPVERWDASYRVNLRGPVLLARAFLPGMVERGYGVFACVSSKGLGYMGAYEAFKTAQVHLAETLDDELQGTGVFAFTIGPGYAPTETAATSLVDLASMMGISHSELQAMVEPQTISIEAAGAGFAAAVALAERYRGQEIVSLQALMDAGIEIPTNGQKEPAHSQSAVDFVGIARQSEIVRGTLAEQSEGWKQRSIFERQWMFRSFKQKAGMPVQDWLAALERLKATAEVQEQPVQGNLPASLGKLASYYGYMAEMAKGYVKDPAQREEQVRIVTSWKEEVERLQGLLEGNGSTNG